MAQGRMIKTRIAKSKKLAELKNDSSRLLYFLIYPHLDVEGRSEADPKIIKSIALPLLNWKYDKIQGCLKDLNRVGLIVLYSNDKDQFLQVTRFKDFQNIREDREAESIIPNPSELTSNAGVLQENSGLSEVKLSKDKISKESFKKPSLSELKSFILTNKLFVEPEQFLDFYESKGWKIGSSQMKDWKAAARNWSRRNKNPNQEVEEKDGKIGIFSKIKPYIPLSER